MEKGYSKAAINLFTGKTNNVNAVLSDIKGLYIADEDFKSYFSVKQFNTNNSTDKKLLRYTLYKLEGQEEGGGGAGTSPSRGAPSERAGVQLFEVDELWRPDPGLLADPDRFRRLEESPCSGRR